MLVVGIRPRRKGPSRNQAPLPPPLLCSLAPSLLSSLPRYATPTHLDHTELVHDTRQVALGRRLHQRGHLQVTKRTWVRAKVRATVSCHLS